MKNKTVRPYVIAIRSKDFYLQNIDIQSSKIASPINLEKIQGNKDLKANNDPKGSKRTSWRMKSQHSTQLTTFYNLIQQRQTQDQFYHKDLYDGLSVRKLISSRNDINIKKDNQPKANRILDKNVVQGRTIQNTGIYNTQQLFSPQRTNNNQMWLPNIQNIILTNDLEEEQLTRRSQNTIHLENSRPNKGYESPPQLNLTERYKSKIIIVNHQRAPKTYRLQ